MRNELQTPLPQLPLSLLIPLKRRHTLPPLAQGSRSSRCPARGRCSHLWYTSTHLSSTHILPLASLPQQTARTRSTSLRRNWRYWWCHWTSTRLARLNYIRRRGATQVRTTGYGQIRGRHLVWWIWGRRTGAAGLIRRRGRNCVQQGRLWLPGIITQRSRASSGLVVPVEMRRRFISVRDRLNPQVRRLPALRIVIGFLVPAANATLVATTTAAAAACDQAFEAAEIDYTATIALLLLCGWVLIFRGYRATI